MIRTLSVSFTLLATLLPAQQNIVYHPNNTVPSLKNAFPFGAARNGVRQQQLIPRSALPTTPAVIQDLFVAHNSPFGTSSTMTEGEIVYGDFEIRIGKTQIGTLTPIWSNNLPSYTTVQKGRLRLRWKRDTWTPLGIQVPYVWIPTPNDDLCVDFILWNVQSTGGITPDVNGYILGTNADNLMARCWLLNWPINQGNASVGTGGVKLGFLLGNGNFVGRGFGCPSSATTVPATTAPANSWPTLGQTFNLQLVNAAPARPAVALLGTSETQFGPVPLPLDFAPFGAGGCNLWVDPALTIVAGATSGTGSATLPLAIPNLPELNTARVFTSWLTIDPAANGFGLVSSDYALMILGI